MKTTTEKIEEIAKRLIDQEVFLNQTSLVCALQDKGDLDFSYEKVSNLFEESEDGESEFKGIFEWFAVSRWLAKKLNDIEEPILENDYGQWWGRTCFGQEIILDGTFQTIAKGLNK